MNRKFALLLSSLLIAIFLYMFLTTPAVHTWAIGSYHWTFWVTKS